MYWYWYLLNEFLKWNEWIYKAKYAHPKICTPQRYCASEHARPLCLDLVMQFIVRLNDSFFALSIIISKQSVVHLNFLFSTFSKTLLIVSILTSFSNHVTNLSRVLAKNPILVLNTFEQRVAEMQSLFERYLF